jgi:hypothetical protein
MDDLQFWARFEDGRSQEVQSLAPATVKGPRCTFEIDGEHYLVVTKRTIDPEEQRFRTLLPRDVLESAIKTNSTITGLFRNIVTQFRLTNENISITKLVDTLCSSLNNEHQLKMFMETHPATVVARSFERNSLGKMASTWKVNMMNSMARKDGYINIHVNDIIAMVQTKIGKINSEHQRRTEVASKLFKSTIESLDNARKQLLDAMEPMKELSTLTGSYNVQSELVKEEAEKEFLATKEDLDPNILFTDWVSEWWGRKKFEYILSEINSKRGDPVFLRTFRDRDSSHDSITSTFESLPASCEPIRVPPSFGEAQ